MSSPNFDRPPLELAVGQKPDSGKLVLYDIATGRVLEHEISLEVYGVDEDLTDERRGVEYSPSLQRAEVELITDRRVHADSLHSPQSETDGD